MSIRQIGDSGEAGNARNLVVFQELADRSKNTKQEQGLLLESDMREAMAMAARRLDQQASKYRVRGFDWDLNDIQYDIARPRLVMATLRIERSQ